MTTAEFRNLLQKNMNELIWRNRGWGPIPIHGKGVTGWSVGDRINYHTAKAKSSTKETDIERHDAMAKKLSATVKPSVSKVKKIGSPSEMASPLAENDKSAGSRTYKNQQEFNEAFVKYRDDLRRSLENTDVFKKEGVLPVTLCEKKDRVTNINRVSNIVECTGNKPIDKQYAKKLKDSLKSLDRYIHPEVAEKVQNQILSPPLTKRGVQVYATKATRASASHSSVDLPKGHTVIQQHHEFGHVLEGKLDPDAVKSKYWLKRRATGGEYHLDTIHPWAYHDEMAIKGNFIDPYVGKVYSNASEAISMGLQHFNSPGPLNEFAKRDFDHFAYTMGIIQGAL